LEHDVPLRRSIPVIPEGCETKCVSGAVRQIEPAFKRVLLLLGVLQPGQTRANEAIELLRIRSFLPKDTAGTGQAIKR
jgi:hypothetical protein